MMMIDDDDADDDNIHADVLLCNEKSIRVFCKFTQLHNYQILLELVNISLSYRVKTECRLML